MDIRPLDLLHALPTCIDVNLYSDFSHQQAASISLRNSFLKKFEPPGENKAANQAALDLFLSNNEIAKSWSPDETSYYYEIALRMKEILRSVIFSGPLQAPEISLSKAINSVLPGPGSSIGTKHTDFYQKLFCSELSIYSSELYKYYREQVPSIWKSAEITRSLQYGSPVQVHASRLTFAKKSAVISRVINTEASLEMMFQKGISTCIEGLLRKFFNINLSIQPTINRLLAKLGSIDGSNATIDLKSSSDLVRYQFVKWLFPPQAFSTLDSVRSKVIELPEEYGGGEVQINMMSTMGNGYTFSLQTLIFATLLQAVYESEGLPTNIHEYPHYSVFGDDIICTKHAYNKVIGMLKFCGLVVNEDKSFNTGAFRESCGQDFFKGRDIRGIYLRKLDKDAHVYSLFNRLTRWSIKHGIDTTEVLRCLYGLPKRNLKVPFDVGDEGGFKVPLCLTDARKVGAAKYKHLVVSKRTVRFPSADPHRNGDGVGRPQNPDGFCIAALGGYVDGGEFSFVAVEKRQPKPPSVVVRNSVENPRYSLKRGTTSSWDFVPHKGLTSLDYYITLAGIVV